MRSGEAARVGPGRRRPQQGVAYLLLLVAVALIGMAAAAALSLGATMARSDAEQQLLAVGAELEQALRSYAGVPVAGTLGPGARGPRTLEDLLRDPRSPGVRRHLRKLYADPLTGSGEWGLVRDSEGFITGVYSRAPGRPIKTLGFDTRWADFEKADTYRDWVFGLVPRIGPRQSSN
jgi:type II secretory pathway pseudopilin PulG